MGDYTPNSVGCHVFTANEYGNAGASRWSSAFVMSTKAIDAAVKGYEYAVGIDHANGSYVLVADGIFSDCRNAGVLGRLLHGSFDLNVVSVLSVNAQYLNENSLTGAEME